MSKTNYVSEFTQLPGLEGVASVASGIGIDDDGQTIDFSLTADGATPTADTGGLLGLQGAPVLPFVDSAAGETIQAVLPAPVAGRLEPVFDGLGGSALQPLGGGAVLQAINPTFSGPAANPFGLTDVGSLSDPTFADIDGDGDLDAFVGDLYGATVFFRSTGSASAPALTAEGSNFGLTDVGSHANPTFADLDGDGDLDAFVGARDGSVRYFVNASPGVTITQSGGGTAVAEGGAGDSYPVMLNSAPTANVTITLNTTNGQVNASAATLVFTSTNWNVPQTVTVSATNDTVGEGAHTGVIGHAVSSADAGYNGLVVAPVRVVITDNDLLQADPATW